MKRDALDIIELGYDLTGTTAAWLERVAAATYEQLGAGLGMQGFVYEVTGEGRMRVGETHQIGLPDGMAAQAAAGMEQMPPAFVRRSFVRCEALTQSQADPEARQIVRPMMEALEATFGWRDNLMIGGMDPSGHGVYLGMWLPEVTRLPARTGRAWSRVAVHLASGYRLRRRLAEAGTSALDRADAVLTPGGRVDHAQDEAQPSNARALLKAAVKQTERARGRLRRSEPEQAIDLWKGLVSGRWSLVDHFDSDGQRYVVARRNDVPVRDLSALTVREQQVVAYAALGHTNKLIAYEMGLSASTVGVLLHRAGKKLGTTTREELVAAYAALHGGGEP